MKITGKGQAIVTFNFDRIDLPDSTTNKVGSNGLVSFRITVPGATSLGTIIKNKAYIYFDYNSPILTNETVQMVGVTVEEDLSKGARVQVINSVIGKNKANFAKLYPNPTTGLVTIEMSSLGKTSELRIYSVIGILTKSITLSNVSSQQVNLGSMEEGMYLYEIIQEGERVAGGMLQAR